LRVPAICQPGQKDAAKAGIFPAFAAQNTSNQKICGRRKLNFEILFSKI
jgi:hypothetical protein